MKTFDLKRFSNALVWLAMTRFHDLLKFAIGFAIFFFFTFLWMGNVEPDQQDYLLLYNSGVLSMVMTVLGFMLVFSGTFVTRDMRTNQERISVLMLPVSNLEKFVSRCVFALLSSLACLIVSVMAADVCQMVFRAVTGNHIVSMTWLLLLWQSKASVWGLFGHNFVVLVTLVSIFFCVHSFYVLGGTFFRRNQWLLTTAACFIISNVLGWFFVMSGPSVFGPMMDGAANWFDKIATDNFDLARALAFGCVNLFTWGLSALFYILAYKLFCRIQLKNTKWTNL